MGGGDVGQPTHAAAGKESYGAANLPGIRQNVGEIGSSENGVYKRILHSCAGQRNFPPVADPIILESGGRKTDGPDQIP